MTRRNGSKMALAATAALILLSPLHAAAAAAQDGGGLFAPRIVINGQVVSNYEVDQRIKFLRVLRVPGDPDKEAITGLTTDRLSAQEAKRLGIRLTAEQIDAGMKEFAGRANLDVPAFVKAINAEGVEAETFRDFVTAGLLWREVVRQKFGQSVRISNVQVDRAMAEAARKPDVKLLLSELVVPVPEGTDPADVLAEVRDIRTNLAAEGGFAAAARQYSASPTAEGGGRLDWMPLSNLPPAISGKLLGLGAGDVSDPIIVPQAVVLFQLNGISDLETPQPLDVKVSYARFALPPGQDGAALLASVDGCGDLYPMARKLPADSLAVTDEVSIAAVAPDVGLALAKLDPGEGVVTKRSGSDEVLMLCTRNGIQPPPVAEGDATAATPSADAPKDTAAGDFVKPDPTREAVRSQLGNTQIGALADAYMEELRSEAIIETP